MRMGNKRAILAARKVAVGVLALAVVFVWTGEGWADPFQPLNTVHAFYDSGRGGAYLGFPSYLDIYIPQGQLPGPYGGWYDGNAFAYGAMYPAHPGYPYRFRNGVADIPSYIFDTEPGGYVLTGPGAASYLRMDALWVANGGVGGTAQRPPYPAGYWTVDQMAGFPNPSSPTADFLSLPGDSAGNSYVVVGANGLWINPLGPGDGVHGGADVLIQQVLSPVEYANLYATPDLVNYTLVGTLGSTIPGTANPAASWLRDFYVDLAAYGITWPVMALKIEGIDLLGDSPGFDLASVGATNLTVIPEPSSFVLLGIALVGFFVGLARRRKARAA